MSNGANVDAANSRGVTALMLAARNNHMQVVEVRHWLYIGSITE